MGTVDTTQSRHGGTRPGAGASGPWLFLVLRAERPLEPPARLSLRTMHEVQLGRGEARSVEHATQGGNTRVLQVGLDDRWLSRRHLRLRRVLSSWVLEDEGSKNGSWVNGTRVERRVLADGDLVEAGRAFFLFRESLPGSDRGDAGPSDPERTLQATLLPGLHDALERAATVARSALSMLVTGPSGSGKELVARGVHRLSGRRGAFAAVNCGALPATLLESALFGHRKGAFTGATQDHEGLVHAAHQGTLFLDEVGDLPLAAQAALLRVLQEGELLPVGATRAVPVDLRVLAATHRDLEAMVREERFREDLLARLAGYTVRLPPLAERREDLGLIIAALLSRIAPGRAAALTLTPEAARALLQYSWPANVRELEKVLHAATVLASGPVLGVEHLPEPLLHAARAAPASVQSPRPLSEQEQQQRAALDEALREARGNVAEVARRLGKGRTQIQRWIERYGLDLTRHRA